MRRKSQITFPVSINLIEDAPLCHNGPPAQFCNRSASPLNKHSFLRHEYKDDFEWIRIIDVLPDQHRYLYFESSIQGVLNLLDHRIPVLEYVAIMAHASKMFAPQPQQILIGGLGSASLWHTYSHWWTDLAQMIVVENNARIVELAREFFGFEPKNTLVEGDFREQLENTSLTYDLIAVDCYSALSIPPQLTTLEFMYLLQSRLTHQGIAVLNLWSPGCNRICADQVYTIAQVFDQIGVIACREDSNLVLIAAKNPQHQFPKHMIYNGLEYPILWVSAHDRKTWPDYLTGAQCLEDNNVSQIFSTTGIDF